MDTVVEAPLIDYNGPAVSHSRLAKSLAGAMIPLQYVLVSPKTRLVKNIMTPKRHSV